MKISKSKKAKTTKKSDPDYFKYWLRSFWRKHWEIIIAAIVGFIVGVFILPKVFR